MEMMSSLRVKSSSIITACSDEFQEHLLAEKVLTGIARDETIPGR